jgi:hypothetical protein
VIHAEAVILHEKRIAEIPDYMAMMFGYIATIPVEGGIAVIPVRGCMAVTHVRGCIAVVRRCRFRDA